MKTLFEKTLHHERGTRITILLAFLILASSASFAQPASIGSEFQINTSIQGWQLYPAVASNATGDFVVVWQSDTSSGDDNHLQSIQGQRYTSDGSRLGDEFQVNSYTTNNQSGPSVAFGPDGGFVVAWFSEGSDESDQDVFSIQAQRHDSNGSRLGGQFQVNSFTPGWQYRPDVAIDTDGDFVVVWVSGGSAGTDSSGVSVQGQRYASDGSTLGGEFQVNTYTVGDQSKPAVAYTADGFVVVWQSPRPTGSFEIMAQRYDSNGSRLGGEFRVNAYTANHQWEPDVESGADGRYVVTWISNESVGDSSGASVHGQRYASDGSAVGDEFQINTYTTGDQVLPKVAFDADGGFFVTYETFANNSSGWDVRSQRYDPDGVPVGDELAVNSYTMNDQRRARVAANADGGFVAVWQSHGSNDNGDPDWSIQAQRFQDSPQAAPQNSFVRATTGNVNVGQYAVVDSYDSCACIYAAVFGDDALIEAGGSVDIDPNAMVSATVSPGTPNDPTPVAMPAGLTLQGNLEVQSNQTIVLAAGDYYYDSVFIKDNSHLQTTGPVRIWFRSRLEVGSNAGVVAAGDAPANLTFNSTQNANFVEVKSNSLFIGSINAPNVNNIRIGSHTQFFGSVTGASVDVLSYAIVHLDTAFGASCAAPATMPNPPVLANALEATAGDVTLGQDALVDSYRSSEGAYDSANALTNGNVQASHNVTLHPSATLSGTAASHTDSSQESVPVPAGLTSSGTLFVNSNQTVTLTAGDYLYDDIHLASNATLKAEGQVRIWFTGKLEIGSNASAVAVSGDPSDLWFFGGCGWQAVRIGGSSVSLVGTIHAPDLSVFLQSNSNVFGAVVGATIEVYQNANVHYDEDLGGQ